METKSQVVMITGATSGFGKATALHLAGIGYKVYGFGRSVVENTVEAGGNLHMMRMDVNDQGSVDAAVAAIMAAEGRIDIVLNAAGLGFRGAIEDVSIEEAKAHFETNFFGTLRVCKAVMPHMRAQKSGLLMMVSSVAGVLGVPFQGIYSASKFAVEGMSDALSMEARPFGIDVVVLEPGDFDTGFTANCMKAAAAEKEESAYRATYVKVLKNIEKDESSGHKADYLSAAVSRIISAKRRKIRYVIGSPLEKIGIILKRIMPQRAFESLLYAYYTMKR